MIAVSLVAVLFAACDGGGDDDEARVEVDELTSIAGAQQVDGRQLNEEIIEDEAQLWEAVTENDYADGWQGGYRAQYADVAGGIERVEVSIDVYDSSDRAEERASVEPRLNDEFLTRRLSPAVVVEEFDDETGIDACSAISIKHTAIVPQFEVYCHQGTAVVFAKAISANESDAIALATELAGGIANALQEAAAADPS